jgi:hypothetical protein
MESWCQMKAIKICQPLTWTMKSLLPIGFLITIMLLSCEKKYDNWTNLCTDFEINYYQGSGWTGWKFNTTITYPDSLIIYEKEYIPSLKERTSKYLIDKNEMDTLFQNLQKIRNINLTDYYGFGPNKPTDLPTTFFKFINCNTIYCPDENEVPTELVILLGRINRIVINHDTLLNHD